MAADETYELEFIVFDQKAQQLIGKPIQRLKSMYDKYETPAEISDLIGQRYTFVVKISAKKSINSDEPSFEVIYVKEQLGRQANIPVFRKTSSLTTNSSSQAVQTSLPSLIPMEPKKIQRKSQHEYHHSTDNEMMQVQKHESDNVKDKKINLGTKREKTPNAMDNEDLKENQDFLGSSKRQRI
ncbi:hypothetical protein PVAP13_4KG362400 [Panicum virgatum]|uniref:Replication factor A C-terminal domain-containing protein n=1 Tax=Panicum virgatum TaxID=38727 RepID=A0A8T0TRF2_PANVG|nr:hypothetical protein PVAP13_4KG362400 [Panicum virgatum]